MRFPWRAAAAASLLAACTTAPRPDADETINTVPTGVKPDIIAFLRTYLNDPTRIRDAALSDPVLKPVGDRQRYVVCLRFNARDSDGRYTGSKTRLVVFTHGRLDSFSEQARETCKDVDLKPFPELEALKR